MAATMAKIADGDDFAIPATIDDPEVLNELEDALRGLGYPINK